jgi:transcription initiation factor IIE alpha subunit
MKPQMHPSRKAVLAVIRKRPDITVERIVCLTGLSVNAVRKHIAQLAQDEMIHQVRLEQKRSQKYQSLTGYRYGQDPDVVATRARLKIVQGHWDVLAHFFGLIAPEAAA